MWSQVLGVVVLRVIASPFVFTIIYYKYKRGFPHHGTGNWVLF